MVTTPQVTVVGGGLGGLTAAIASAEAGARVTVFEAHSRLGGRARSTPRPYVANEGPHVFYSDGPHWPWLVERGLVAPYASVPLVDGLRTRLRHRGRLRASIPASLLKPLTRRSLRAPVDEDFATWATDRFGPESADAMAKLIGVVTFEANAGRLSAAFVWERVLRVARLGYPAARYVHGGWQAVVDRMAALARRLGVRIETNARVDTLPLGSGPVIVATSLAAARSLLGDDSLTWESGRTALLDIGVQRRRGDAFIVFDLDHAGFYERYSGPDPSAAPAGHSLVQTQMPLHPSESKADGITRAEAMLDLAMPGWRERTTWRQSAVATGRTGALDLPGTTWRDRPAIDRGDGVYLVGDQVAAPGLLGEVTLASARQAAHLAVGAPAPGMLTAA